MLLNSVGRGALHVTPLSVLSRFPEVKTWRGRAPDRGAQQHVQNTVAGLVAARLADILPFICFGQFPKGRGIVLELAPWRAGKMPVICHPVRPAGSSV